MVRDWDAIKEVLEEVRDRNMDNQSIIFAPAARDFDTREPVDLTEEDAKKRDEWAYAAMILAADGSLLTHYMGRSQRDQETAVRGLSMKGHDLLDMLSKPTMLEHLRSLGDKVSTGLVTKASEEAVKYAIQYIANNGI